MTAEDRRPIEASLSRRRASTADGTGLDYATGCRVEEDILSRIRSLLLSRNSHFPPRTLYVSAEDHNRCSEQRCMIDTSDRFDFGTATSITRFPLRPDSGTQAFPVTPQLRSRSTTLRMDGARRSTQTFIPFQKRSLRATSSTNDLSAALDDTAIHESFLPCCPPCPPEGKKRAFRLPRLVLGERSVKKKRDPNFRSCIDFTPRGPLVNDTRVKKVGTPYCSHDAPSSKSSNEFDQPRYLSGEAMKAEPADLTCFLAGCDPRECKTHSRRSSQPVLPRGKCAVEQVDKGGADDLAKFGLDFVNFKQAPRATLGAWFGSKDTVQTVIRHRPNESDTERPHLVNGRLKSPTSSNFSLDMFPHALHSQEMATKDALEQHLSSVVVTNFSLPGPKAQKASPKDTVQLKQTAVSLPRSSDAVRFTSPVASLSKIAESASAQRSGKVTNSVQPKKSNASLRSKTYSASLRSVSSKAASIRHALLKNPESDVVSVNASLPVPPFLTQFSVGGPDVVVTKDESHKRTAVGVLAAEEPESLTALDAAHGVATDVVVHLTSMGKAKDLAERIKFRGDKTERKEERERNEDTAITTLPPAQASDATSQQASKSNNKVETAFGTIPKSITSLKELLSHPNSAQQPADNDSRTISKTPPCCPDLETQSPQNTTEVKPRKPTCCPGRMMQPSQSTTLEDLRNTDYWGFVPAVKEAVQEAVQVAVRKAVEETIILPSNQQDEASDVYGRLVGDLLVEAAKVAEHDLRNASLWNEPPSSIRERSGGDLEFPGKVARDPYGLSSTPKANLYETVPLERFDDRFVENNRHSQKPDEKKPPGNWNGLAKKCSSGYVAIPARSSSKSRISGFKNQTTPNSSVKESPRSCWKETSKATTSLRSVCSVRSLKSFRSCDGDQAHEQDPTGQGILGANTDSRSVEKKLSVAKLGQRNTDHWLRRMLSTSGSYAPRLTTMQPRTRREKNTSPGRIRSQVASALLDTELCNGNTPRVDQSRSAMANTGDKTKIAGRGDVVISIPEEQQTTAMTETFNKTINDLDFLLNEALFIARQAAEKECPGGGAADVLSSGRKGIEDELVERQTLNPRYHSRRQSQKRSDDISSVPSMHESFGSFSSSDSEDRNECKDGERDSSQRVPIPSLILKAPTAAVLVSTEGQQPSHETRRTPTGRAPTPFPPGSTVPSPVESVEHSLWFESPTGGNNGISLDVEMPGMKIKDDNPFLTENVGNTRKISQISPTKRSRSTTGRRSQQTTSCALDDLALAHRATKPAGPLPMPPITPRHASLVKAGKRRTTQTDSELIKTNFPAQSVPTKQEVREYIRSFNHPPIQTRASSLRLRKDTEKEQAQPQEAEYSRQNIDRTAIELCLREEEMLDPAQAGLLARSDSNHDLATSISKSYDGSQSEAIHFDTGFAHRQHFGGSGANGCGRRDTVELRDTPKSNLPQITQRGGKGSHLFNLKGRSHISLRGEHHKGFSFARAHKKPRIARDWAPARKRFVAIVACVSTALVGTLVGVYAAEVPAIQYWIVDFHHYTILGNVFFFIGLSIPTFFFWPLPLLHGRKPYTLGAMSLAMPLLFPQALAVGQFRSPYVDYWRIGLIFPRALMGFILGFANMNFKATLLDLFGASLQSENPHQEVADENDVRRHGGGLGVWLGIWTWCAMGSIGVGFLIGAIIINHLNPAWGFYISIAIIAFVLFLNVLCPEVRRSAFRRSVAELKHEDGVSRRLGRGEVKMHMVQTGPKWWGEEFHYGIKMNAKMLRQPGFMILAVYVSWIYGQIILLVVLLGSLVSNSYKFKSPYVGASVMAIPAGAFLAIPFQKASLFSRSRGHREKEDDNTETLNRKVTLSSHLVRRAIFILVLPFVDLAYTISSKGPPVPFIIPILFAGLIGFLSNLAMGECHGIIMETFDTSDLQPGMTGRPRGSSGDRTASKRTNYSSFPRVSSGFAITEGIGFLFAAAATGVGGVATRNWGQQAATGVMAGILLVLSLLLLGVLYRFRDVQIIPNSKQEDMLKWKNARRTSAILRAQGIGQTEEWRPVIIGNPTHTMRRMCILEMGGMTRWSEIRRKNHLVDQNTLESKHPNLAVIKDVERRIKAAEEEIVHHVRRSISRHSLSRNSSRRSKKSDRSYEQGDLGGHCEMLSPSGSTSHRRQRGKSRILE